MTRSQQQFAILAVLVCIMVAVYARALRPKPPSAPMPAQGATSQAGGATAPAVGAEAPSARPGPTLVSLPDRSSQHDAQRDRVAQLSWSRDPFTKGNAAGGMSGLVLSGILWDPKAPMVILNGQMLQVGGELEGYRVTEITPDHVSVTDGTDTLQLLIAP